MESLISIQESFNKLEHEVAENQRFITKAHVEGIEALKIAQVATAIGEHFIERSKWCVFLPPSSRRLRSMQSVLVPQLGHSS